MVERSLSMRERYRDRYPAPPFHFTLDSDHSDNCLGYFIFEFKEPGTVGGVAQMVERSLSMREFKEPGTVGGVAQMVERSLSMREVPGSIPGASISFYSRQRPF
ncbi:hypothetical protein CEXT_274081 [Caerostris extrusa]|uniref:Uncharacterized protein n=1 Tax=Caerostris extrusa TaxID=172846 RepID=A0AAV4MIL8_CAEEX|nr:hypothetical protein CEXT_274081 [Caerostris extrusa]